MCTLLSQVDPTKFTQLYVWGGVLAFALFVLWGIWAYAKKVTRNDRSDHDPRPSFSLDELDRLHAESELNDEEYELAREKILIEIGSCSLQDLRDLRAAGRISNAAFECARNTIVAAAKAKLRGNEDPRLSENPGPIPPSPNRPDASNNAKDESDGRIE